MISTPSSPLVNLSRDFSKLYNNPNQADIVIYTGTPDPTPFYAHSLILQCRSVYFDMALSDTANLKRNEDGLISFDLPYVNQHAFSMLLRYFYSGTVDWIMGFKPETPLWTKKSEPERKRRPPRRSSSNFSTLQLLNQNNQSFLLSSDDESDYFGDSQSELSLTQSAISFASSSSGESDVRLPFQSINIPKLKSSTDYTSQGNLLLDVLVAASDLIVESLIQPLQQHLVDKYHVYLRKNVFKIFELADTYDWSILRLRCTEILCMDPYAYFRTVEFTTMKKHLLIDILQRSDLRMEEFDIWCACLYWAYSHALKQQHEEANGTSTTTPSSQSLATPIRPQKPFERSLSPQPRRSSPDLLLYASDTALSDDDECIGWSEEQVALVQKVKKHLSPLIPCIRFLILPGHKYIEYVEPYKIVPPKLRQKLLHHYIVNKLSSTQVLDNLPPRLSTPRESCSVSSNLISGYDKLFIEHWIIGDKSNNCTSLAHNLIPRPSPAHPSYRESTWKQLYSSTLHGNDMKAFHLRCDNQGPTVTVIKIKGTNEIIGGYNSQSWRSEPGGRYSFAKAFLFTLSGTGTMERQTSRPTSALDAKLSIDTSISDFTEDRACSPLSEGTFSSFSLSPTSAVEPSLDSILDKLQLTPEPSDAIPDAEPDSYVISPTSTDNPSVMFSYEQKTSMEDEEKVLGSKTQIDDVATALSQPRPYPEPTLHSLKRAHLHYAIHNHAAYGPIFGGGHDLFIGNPIDEATSFCRSYAYEGQIRSGNENDFAIEEMEVWSVRMNQIGVFDPIK